MKTLPRWARTLAAVLVVGATYYVAGRLSLRLSLVGRSVTPLWPPTGIALVAFLVLGRRVWPGVALAAFLVNLRTGAATAAAIAAGNTIAPLLACTLLDLIGFRRSLDRTRDALALVFLGALSSMTVSATIGTLTLAVAGRTSPQTTWATWSVWWAGDAMGVLAVAPFLLSLGQWRRGRVSVGRAVELVALVAAVAATAFALLSRTEASVWVVAFPVLGWAAWRFQQRGAAPAALVVIGAASWAAAHGLGPFLHGSLPGKMVTLQAFNAAAAVTSFFFAALVAERTAARRALEESAGRLEEEVRHRTAELQASNRRLQQAISARQETQETLTRREFQLSAARSMASIGSWEWDVLNDSIEWSDELYRIYGVDPATFEATYEAYIRLVHPDDLELVTSTVERALETRSAFGFDHRVIRPDGTERVLQASGTVVTDEHGAPVRMLGISHDITEQIEAVRALRESEEVLRTLFESAVVGIARCAPDGLILETNVALQRLLDFDDAGMRSRSLIALAVEADRTRFQDLLDRMLRREVATFEIEMRMSRSDGSEVWTLTAVSMVRNDDDEARFAHAIVRDISERKHAEELQRDEAERVRLRSLFERVPAAVLVTRGAAHVVDFANDAFLQLLGARQCVGLPARMAFPELEELGYLERMDEALETGQPQTANETLVRASGTAPADGYFNFSFQPLRDADDGVEGIMAHGIEVTDAVRARLHITESLAFLDTLLATAPAGFAVFDSDSRYIHINQRLAEINGLTVDAHLGRTIRDVRPDIAPAIEPILRRVMEDREPVIDQHLAGTRWDAPDETRHLLASFYPVLTADGRLLGVGVVVVEITEQKRVEELLAAQKEVLELVARGSDLPAALAAVVHLTEDHAAPDVHAAIMLVDRGSMRLRVGAAPSIPNPFRDALDGMPVDANIASCGAAAHERASVIIADIAGHPNWTSLRHLALGAGYRAAWAAPILAGDNSVSGTVCMYCTTTRLPSDQELSLLDVATQTAAIALERERGERERRRFVEREREAQARLYQREHRIAETLQRSLLPGELPVMPDVGISARYIPAGADVEVGGDWYDVISLPDGALGIAIGDVAGHGVGAAAAMGQMRMALRAYAMDSLAPAVVLERLNVLLHELQPDAMATLAFARLDHDAGTLTLASAGHPPPLLLGDGPPRYVRGGLSPPLGVDSSMSFEQATVDVPDGVTLFFYTDGLIERRTESIDEGLARLADAASEAPDDLDAAADHIIARLLDGRGGHDDTALLIVHRVPLAGRTLELRLPSEPLRLQSMRRIMGRWLRHNGASEEEATEVLIAATEATTNAMRHAYGTRAGWIDIEASATEDEIVVGVRDFGRWRAPDRGQSQDGGRGLTMMRGLMGAVEISAGAEGTHVRMRRRRGVIDALDGS